MKKYLYEYFDGMSGEEKIFDKKEEALKTAKDYFNHLTKTEKSKIEYFYIVEIEAPKEMDNDDLLELWNLEDYWTADIWDFGTEMLAEKIRKADTWSDDLNRELCELAGIGSEYETADGDSFETVVFKAAEILNVDIQ